MIPKLITKEHILAALSEIDQNNIDDPQAKFKIFKLVYQQKEYPPKYTISLAHEQATGQRLGSREFTTTEAQRYLRNTSSDFRIVTSHDNPQQQLIERYKQYLLDDQLQEERYKWELVAKYKGRPNIDTTDFEAEISSIDYDNLIWHDAEAVKKHLAREASELYCAAFRSLFDESRPLQERINIFRERVDLLYKELAPTLQHNHDERTIATFLTFHDPNIYSFYKDSFYSKYCRLIGQVPAQARLKYVHYLSLIGEFIRDYVSADNELLELMERFRPENGYEDRTHTLLAQDILYRMLDKRYATFTAIVDDLREGLADAESVLNQFVPGRMEDLGLKDNSFVWIIDGQKILNSVEAHYEVSVRKQGTDSRLYVDIHFEGKNKKQIKKLVGELPAKCEWFIWHKGESIRYRNGISLSDEQLIVKVKGQLLYLEENLGDQVRSILQNTNSTASTTESMTNTLQDLNQILYGPPGTGKTFYTIEKALRIINEAEEEQLDWTDRQAVTALFKKQVAEGRIVFTTFHQSMTYEDFIEGLKPETTDENKVIYRIQNGLFKEICIHAARPEIKSDNFDTIYTKLLNDIEKAPEKKLVLETLVHSKEFTIYKNSKGNLKFHANTEKAYEAVILKKVLEHYLKTGETLDWPSYVKAVANYLTTSYGYTKEATQVKKAFVLIIDEINRGNVSQIFGELITLIEPDKRAGNKEALSVILPYSKEPFDVPNNVFVIGTMNTADRSVEALDTALRRRFVFHEMAPRPGLIASSEEQKIKLGGIDTAAVLSQINARIEVLLDRDHLIGHSFFMNIENAGDFIQVVQNKVLPLLQEYFYGDYGKIGLILGEGFVQVRKRPANNLFAAFKSYDTSVFDDKEMYTLVDYSDGLPKMLHIDGLLKETDFKMAIDILLR